MTAHTRRPDLEEPIVHDSSDVDYRPAHVKPLLSNTAPLAERLDPAIGETTTGMGALLTEMIRRTLKSGVQKIDDELQVYVVEKVETTLSDELPKINESATRVAEKTAHDVADKLINDSVDKINEKITNVENETEEKLNNRIEDLLDKAKSRASQLHDAIKAINDSLVESTDELRQHAQSSVKRQEEINGRFETKAAEILQRIKQEENQRKVAEDSVRVELGKFMQEASRQILQLKEQNSLLLDRLETLERPKGLKAVWNKMFGRRG